MKTTVNSNDLTQGDGGVVRTVSPSHCVKKTMRKSHEVTMRAAIRWAKKAALKGDVPVGAVIVHNGKIIAGACNMREQNDDPSAHAEIIALKKAGRVQKSWNLSGCDMYVTLEPCCMCAGALVNARIKNLYFGAHDHRFGACGSVYDIVGEGKLNHTVSIQSGILKDECSGLLKDFFKARR